MTLGSSYYVKATAVNSQDPTMTVTKIVHIDTVAPAVQIAYIDGCNRLFSADDSF